MTLIVGCAHDKCQMYWLQELVFIPFIERPLYYPATTGRSSLGIEYETVLQEVGSTS